MKPPDLKGQWPYLLALALIFWCVPILAWYTGFEMMLVLIVLPLAVSAVSVVYGVLRGFSVWLAVFAGAIFLTTLFAHYNATAWVYSVIYVFVSIISSGMGSLCRKIFPAGNAAE